eukprot:CAMPEP_0116025736 /NCGR_PEP_ID=MMETSP0321-20121206/13282_1 /TAXON_ID=163516 /ORGANISM="Leptocylindrus danicus var. danicus, Strain B650" /LENGTH=777 /DNA_ID=CAMNT_0003498099 /DNA_START=196 /DNA_END=2526 /DNA_ORIENTATION=+
MAAIPLHYHSDVRNVNSSSSRRKTNAERIATSFSPTVLIPSSYSHGRPNCSTITKTSASLVTPSVSGYNSRRPSSQQQPREIIGTDTSPPRRLRLFLPVRSDDENDQINEPNIITSPVVRKKMEETRVLERLNTSTPEIPDPSELPACVTPQKREDLSSHITSVSGDDGGRSEYNNQVLRGLKRSESFVRRERVRTLEQDQRRNSDIATTERMKRNTDSMLEDAAIAKQLRRRLAGRWEQITKKTIKNTDLSDFLMKSIMEGSLDAVAAAKPTSSRRQNAANIAMQACMGGYFVSIEDEDLQIRARNLFAECLQREEYDEGDFICRENDVGNKFYVIEEGTVRFSIDDQVAGHGQNGSSFGELCIVYGVRRQASVKAVTQCVIAWSIDDLSFRRIQALVAIGSLKNTKSNFFSTFPQRASSLTDLQESGKWKASSIQFNDLKKLSKIGKGTFGSVYMVTLKGNGKRKNSSKYYGLKCMSKASITENKNEKRVLIEKNALQSVSDSSFIISLMGTYQDKDSIYFLSELVQGGNLMKYMIEKDILNHSESMFFCANIAAGLTHVHKNGFIHRDIKPENCLIGQDGYIKLCDFGMAKRLPATIMLPNGGIEVVSLAFTMCGTPEFMAPEFVLSTGYDKGVDWWALGCVLVEMYNGRSPFDFNGDLKKTFREVCLIGMGRKTVPIFRPFKKQGMEAAADIVKSFLSKASERIGSGKSSDVLNHRYFDGIGTKDLLGKRINAPYVPRFSTASDTSHFSVDEKCKAGDDDDSSVISFHGDNSW